MQGTFIGVQTQSYINQSQHMATPIPIQTLSSRTVAPHRSSIVVIRIDGD